MWKNLLQIGGFTAEQIDAVMESIVGMEESWHYRNKQYGTASKPGFSSASLTSIKRSFSVG